MGNQLAVGGSLQELHLQDLGEGIVQERTLGGGRLLKSVQCWSEDVEMPVVVKVYLKKDDGQPMALQTYHDKLKLLSEKLSLKNQPNVLMYHRMVETDKAGYLMRQYCYSNLADRISTRPFFSNLSKKWIAYQILSGLHQIRQAGLAHGDIKAENIVLTGWDWVFLTDLAPYKPVTLPADDPSNFAYFFDTAERRICLIAPERFSSSSSSSSVPTGVSSSSSSSSSSASSSTSQSSSFTANNEQQVTEQMDVFSVGCVLAQLFLDGEALFDLSQLLAYRKGETEHLTTCLNRIEDTNVRQMIAHMLQLEPEKRYTAQQYLQKWSPRVFPPYFQWVHENILSQMVLKSCDDRISLIAEKFDTLIQVFKQGIVPGTTNTSTAATTNNNNVDRNEAPPRAKSEQDSKSDGQVQQQKALITETPTQDNHTANNEHAKNLNSNDGSTLNDIIDKATQFKKDIEKNNLAMNDLNEQQQYAQEYNEKMTQMKQMKQKSTIDVRANQMSAVQRPNQTNLSNSNKGTEIIASLLCSSVRNARIVSSRVKGLILMQQLSDFASNYTRLQRLVPYTCVMLNNPSPLVKSTAIRTLTYVLAKITEFPASEANLFNDYILPALRPLMNDPSDMVKVTFAEHLPLLAYEARRFLEMGEVIKQNAWRNNNAAQIGSSFFEMDGVGMNTNTIKGTYDADLNMLQDEIGSIAQFLFVSECAAVKRALLKNIMQLCIFYGTRKAVDSVLSIVITFLNGREWRLRHAFFEQIVGISVFVGPVNLNDFILPCIMQALHDTEEAVIEQALSGVVALCELGMFYKRTLFDLANRIRPLLHHPNTWIRYDAVAFFAAVSKQIGLADTSCFLLDILRPHLKDEIFVVSESSLLQAVKAPIARHLYEKVLSSSFDNLLSLNHLGDSSIEAKVARWKQILTLPEMSNEDAEKLDLMKPFIDQIAMSLQSKMYDQNISSSHTELITGEPIKLNLQLHTHYIAVESPFAPLQHHTGPSNTSNRTKEQKPFQHEWSAFFNKPNPRKIVGGNTSNIGGSSPMSVSSPSGLSGNSMGSGIFTSGVSSLSKKELNRFRPTGQICAQSHEHKGSINELAVHDSLSWFVSGGNDGTVRLWDLKQSDRDYSMVSKMTCHVPSNGKVMGVAILNLNTPLIAAGTDTGCLSLFSPETGTSIYDIHISEQGTLFSSPTDSQLPSINVVRPFTINLTPLLMVGNQSGMIVGIDPRIRREAFRWKSRESVQQGPITAICGEESWMVSGTRRGFITLWDLRFQISVFTNRISHTRINRIGVYNEPTNNSAHGSASPSIYVAAGTRDVKLWNLESGKVSAVYRSFDKRLPVSSSSRSTKPQMKMNSSSTSLDSSGSSDGSSTPQADPIRRRLSGASAKDPFAIKELERINWERDDANPQASYPFEVKALHVNPDGNFLSGSSDCRIRYWDSNHPEQSYILSGLETTESSLYHVQTDVPTSGVIGGSSGSGFSTPSTNTVSTTTIVAETIKALPNQSQSRKGGAFSSPISTKHVDTITDIKLVGTHAPMVLSSSRDGVLKMWI